MEKTETDKRTNQYKTLAIDPIYFKYIFKKTEKIVCAVFYILHSGFDERSKEDIIVRDAETSAQRLLDVSLAMLGERQEEADRALYLVGHKLIELESKLRILNASRVLSNEHMLVFQNEIEGLFRSIHAYTPQAVPNPLLLSDEPALTVATKSREPRPREPQRQKNGDNDTSILDRRGRVLTILKEKGQASIKDVAALIAGVSEKTIQRELNSLIKDGLIVREGERRWSIYKPF